MDQSFRGPRTRLVCRWSAPSYPLVVEAARALRPVSPVGPALHHPYFPVARPPIWRNNASSFGAACLSPALCRAPCSSSHQCHLALGGESRGTCSSPGSTRSHLAQLRRGEWNDAHVARWTPLEPLSHAGLPAVLPAALPACDGCRRPHCPHHTPCRDGDALDILPAEATSRLSATPEGRFSL